LVKIRVFGGRIKESIFGWRWFDLRIVMKKLSFVRDKYIPLKREYIKSLNGRSNVQLMVAKYGV
jgi:hypothetical protein